MFSLPGMDMNRIYFDHNATTPLAPEAADAMRPFLEGEFGNASSHHWAGERARETVDGTRRHMAKLLCCETDEVIFTSGGTEANNSALLGVYFGSHGKTAPHFVISAFEHPSITATCSFLERLGATVTRVAVDRFGMVNPNDVERAITAATVLVSVMHANNEVGTIQPITQIAAIARTRGVLMHTDAAQSVGKVPVEVTELGVDLLTVAGHKMYAPQGVGALYVRRGTRLEPFLHGGGHETGRRAGTENLIEIAGLGAACQAAQRWLRDNPMRELRDYFWTQLEKRFGGRVVLNGHPELGLPNTLNVSFVGQQGGEILSRIPQLAASTGSACHAGDQHISPVLQAMAVPAEIAHGAIRFSLGRTSTTSEVDIVVEQLAAVLPCMT
jgi:cysteine desulfurase